MGYGIEPRNDDIVEGRGRPAGTTLEAAKSQTQHRQPLLPNLVSYLESNEPGYMTRSSLTINGGFVL